MKDFFNGKNYRRMKLTEELLEKGIVDIHIENKPRQIKVIYESEGQAQKPLVIPVLEFVYPTVDQLDELVNGTMGMEVLTLLKGFIIVSLGNHWSQIYDPNEKDSTKVELALEVTKQNTHKLFIDEYKIPHIAIPIDDHLEIFRIESKSFKNWCRMINYKQNGSIIDSSTLDSICGILNAEAEFNSGDPINLNLRVAQNEIKVNGDIKTIWYYDLTNKNWEFVEITSEGWRVIQSKDLILFERFSTQLPQVYPSENHSDDVLNKFIELVLNKHNVEEDKLQEYRLLLKCYVICAFIPGFPNAIPMPNGTQGAAKTTLMNLVKMVIDPSQIKSLSFPKDKDELIQQLAHNYVLFYDNISKMREWISDELCRAVSGSGSTKRKLYTDNEDIIYNFQRLVGFNGINIAATKPDLLDRGIFFILKRIADENRRYIIDIQREFEELRPHVLGYILDILVKVLKWKEENNPQNNNGTSLSLAKIPRMADWAYHCEIIARCMGYGDLDFLKAYENNSKIQIEEVIETSQIATCLLYFVDNVPGMSDESLDIDVNSSLSQVFKGTATELKSSLEKIAPEIGIDINNKDWPKKPNQLIRTINEIIHTLKEIGIKIEYSNPTGRKKIVTISRVSSESSNRQKFQTETQNVWGFSYDRADDVRHSQSTSSRNGIGNGAQNLLSEDSYDTYDGSPNIDKNNLILSTKSVTSQTVGSDKLPSSTGDLTATAREYDCYECLKQNKRFSTDDKLEYEKHFMQKHHGKTAYPGKPDLEKYGWKAQGRGWEV